MLKNILILPDGTELSSGAGNVNAIKSVTLTECVNSGTELTIGSVCANMLEVSVIAPDGGLPLTAGDKVILYKEDGTSRQLVGGFTLEKPTYPSSNTMQLTGYDAVTQLDKDLTAWLADLKGWPYNILTFAGMVCGACGLQFVSSACPNSDYMVQQFTAQATGRQLMGWLAEICCRFCHATPQGDIEFAWYTPSGISIHPSGERYYFQKGLSYENYTIAPIEAVQLRLADSESGALYPEAAEGANSYIISSNPVLFATITEDVFPVLENIKQVLVKVAYTPCRVTIPASMDLRAGHTVQITDKNGKTITAYVMTKTQKGQRDTLECTGSPRRDSAAAANNRSAEDLAQTAAKNAFAGLTHAQIFNKLTDGGKIQGIYVQDSKWYINAQYAKIINLKAESVTAGILSSTDGKSYFDLDKGQIVTNNIIATGGTIGGCSIVNGKLQVPAANITGTLTAAQVDADNLTIKAGNVAGTLKASQIDTTDLWVDAAHISGTITAGKIVVKNTGGSTLLSAGDGAVSIAGWHVDSNSLYSGSSFSSAECFLCTGSAAALSIGGSAAISGWVFKAGSKFGVTKSGAFYASDGHLTGTINATSGKIANWTISTNGYLEGSGGPNTIRLYPKGWLYGGSTYYIVIFTGGGTPVGGITASGWKTI